MLQLPPMNHMCLDPRRRCLLPASACRVEPSAVHALREALLLGFVLTGCAGCSNNESDLPRTAPKLPRMALSTQDVKEALAWVSTRPHGQTSLPERLEITTPTIRQGISNPWKNEWMCAWSNHIFLGMGTCAVSFVLSCLWQATQTQWVEMDALVFEPRC